MKVNKYTQILSTDIHSSNNEKQLFYTKLNKQSSKNKFFSYIHSKYSLPFLEVTNLSNSSSKGKLRPLNSVTMIGFQHVNSTKSLHNRKLLLNNISLSNQINTRNKNNNDYYNIDFSLKNTYHSFLLGNFHPNTKENSDYFKHLTCTKPNNSKEISKNKIKVEKKLKRISPIHKELCFKTNHYDSNINIHNICQLTNRLKKHYTQILNKNTTKDTQVHSSNLIHLNKKKIYENISLNIKKQISQINIHILKNPHICFNHQTSKNIFSNKQREYFPLIVTQN